VISLGLTAAVDLQSILTTVLGTVTSLLGGVTGVLGGATGIL
jgi:hypothetical protein